MTGLLWTALSACTGAPAGDEAQAPPVVSEVLLEESWQVQVSEPGALDALAQSQGWRARFGWDLAGAAAGFAGSPAELARIHAEIGALYRQAALIQAHAIVQTYRPGERREGDPEEVEYLLGVAYVVLGDLDRAREHLGKSEKSGVGALADGDAAWAARASAPDFQLSLSEDPRLYPLPSVEPGLVPAPPPAPHYQLPETVGDLEVPAADPTVLLQLALWHRAAAAAADPTGLAVLAPYTLPLEPPVEVGEADLPALFLGPWPTAADLTAAAEGELPRGFFFAEALEDCGPAPQIDCAERQALGLANQLQEAMTDRGGPNADWRRFSQLARTGLLRLASQRAFQAGEKEIGARLMVSALDLQSGAEADPIFMLQVASWDASVRNTLRAQELLHGQAGRLPGLEGARVALDALSVRVGRDAGPAVPLH